MVALYSHFRLMATHLLTSMKRIKLYGRHSTWNSLLSCRCFIEPLRTPRCAASGCRLNRFYCGSCMLIQCGNCWHNCRKRSRHVVIVLRAALCLSDSQCRLSDCLGHCRNSLASERAAVWNRMMLIVPQVAPSCVRILEAYVCAIVPHFTPDASHATSSLFPGGEIRTDEWHRATTHSNITAEPEAVWQHSKGCCITSFTYYIVHYKCLKLSWVCVRLLFIKLSLRTQQP